MLQFDSLRVIGFFRLSFFWVCWLSIHITYKHGLQRHSLCLQQASKAPLLTILPFCFSLTPKAPVNPVWITVHSETLGGTQEEHRCALGSLWVDRLSGISWAHTIFRSICLIQIFLPTLPLWLSSWRRLFEPRIPLSSLFWFGFQSLFYCAWTFAFFTYVLISLPSWNLGEDEDIVCFDHCFMSDT